MMTSSNGNISALLALCAWNSPVIGEFHAQWTVTRSFDVFFDLCLNKRLIKQWRLWFESTSYPLWRHCNDGKKAASTFIHRFCKALVICNGVGFKWRLLWHSSFNKSIACISITENRCFYSIHTIIPSWWTHFEINNNILKSTFDITDGVNTAMNHLGVSHNILLEWSIWNKSTTKLNCFATFVIMSYYFWNYL